MIYFFRNVNRTICHRGYGDVYKRQGMISGFMLALTLSIDEFAVTVFTIGNQGLETLSTYIYADARKGGLTPELRPLSAIIFVVVLEMCIRDRLCAMASRPNSISTFLSPRR